MIKKVLAALALVFAAATAAWAAGLYTNGMPTQYSSSLHGPEEVPLDTYYPAGRSPQTIGAFVPQLQAGIPNTLTDAATITPDGTYTLFTVRLGGNRTIANLSPNPPPNSKFAIMVIQDSTGSRLVTWGSKYKWVGFTAPTLTTTPARADLVTCTYYGFTSNYVCDIQKNIQP